MIVIAGCVRAPQRNGMEVRTRSARKSVQTAGRSSARSVSAGVRERVLLRVHIACAYGKRGAVPGRIGE